MTPFDEFWAAYPRRVAKGDARKAWEKAAKREPELLAKVSSGAGVVLACARCDVSLNRLVLRWLGKSNAKVRGDRYAAAVRLRALATEIGLGEGRS